MAVNRGHHFDLRRCTPMTRVEEHRCASEYVKTGAPSLATRLITANLRLVVMIARGYRRLNCDLVDLVQEGNLGLIHAVARYDPHRGVKLSTYAGWWIRAYILKYTISNWRLVKMGTTQAQRKLFFNLLRERHKLERRGVEAEPKQLAAALDVKEEDVSAMLERFSGREASLDASRIAGGTERRSLVNTLSAPGALQPDRQAESSEFARRVEANLTQFALTLRGRELEIFRRRLLSEEPETLAHLAVGFGVTRERARQLEQRLKERIRHFLEADMGDSLGEGLERARPRSSGLLVNDVAPGPEGRVVIGAAGRDGRSAALPHGGRRSGSLTSSANVRAQS